MTKKEFIDLANELLKEENLENREADLQLLRREFRYLSQREDETYSEAEETEKVIKVFNELAKKDPRLNSSAQEEKKKIIAEARKLLEKKEIIAASREMDRLNQEFRKAGRSSKKEIDDELWEEFRAVKDEFYEKKRLFFEELDKSNAEKRAKKEDIVERAKKVIKNENVREANQQMDALRKEWKEVGYSGKGDDYLWKDFTKVMDEFQEKKKEHYAEMQKVFVERAEKKEELIKTARLLLANSEFTDEEVEKVKNLRNEFKAIGFAGKEKDDDLYQRFNEIIKKYFDEMKFYKD